MIIDISNSLDKIVGNHRFVSDEHKGIELVVGFNEAGDEFNHLLSESIVDFSTVEEIDKVLAAISELKEFALPNRIGKN